MPRKGKGDRADLVAQLKKKGVNVRGPDLDVIMKVLKAAQSAHEDEELRRVTEQSMEQERQIQALTTQLEALQKGLRTMELELGAAHDREEQLREDLQTAGELTKDIARLEEQLATERTRTLGVMDVLKQENLEVGNDRRQLRLERDQARDTARAAAEQAKAQVAEIEAQLATEAARRLSLSRDYSHVSQWMSLVASGRQTWQPGRSGDRGSVAEAMAAGEAETTWVRSCAAWMRQIDLADVLRDDYLLMLQQQQQGRQRNTLSSVQGVGELSGGGQSLALGEAGGQLDTAAAREATRLHMADTMDGIIGLLQKHRTNLRHVFLSYCRSWPFGISAELLASCSQPHEQQHKVVAPGDSSGAGMVGAGEMADGGGEWGEGGMTLSEFWRLVQDLGMSHTVLSRDDADLVFLRANKAVYDRLAFCRAVAAPDSTSTASGGVVAASAEAWVQRFQTLDCAMSFPQFCEAVVRLAVLHIPRVPWGEKPTSTRDLRGRVEFFLTHNLYTAAVKEEAAPYDLQRAYRQARERPKESADDLAAFAKAKAAASAAAVVAASEGTGAGGGPAEQLAAKEAKARRARLLAERSSALNSLKLDDSGGDESRQ